MRFSQCALFLLFLAMEAAAPLVTTSAFSVGGGTARRSTAVSPAAASFGVVAVVDEKTKTTGISKKFQPSSSSKQRGNTIAGSKRLKMGMSSMESDFASAMPAAPELTTRELLLQAADRTIATFRGSLGDGVEAVPELDALIQMRDQCNNSDNNDTVTDEQLALAIYELMIERGMTYDEQADTGILTPTEFDVMANLDVPEVVQIWHVADPLWLLQCGKHQGCRDAATHCPHGQDTAGI
jgi:hypothetical protein